MSKPQLVAADKIASNSAFDNHEAVYYLHDNTSGMQAYVAIHSTTLGPAHGGTRIKVYKSEDDALRDVLLLSQAMSYKSALVGLPYGGAKGVIIWDGNKSTRLAVLKAYAESVQSLGGKFKTGTDVGITDEDVLYMSQYSNYFLGLHQNGNHDYSISSIAARGVLLAIKTALRYQHGDDNLKDKTINIKGVGKLGNKLAELLVSEGTNLNIADIDSTKTESLQIKYPDQVRIVESQEIHSITADVYSPCSLGNEFTDTVITSLGSKIIVGGANNQLPDNRAGDELFKRGILYAPDIVVNSGGLIAASEDLEIDGFHTDRIDKRLEHINETLTEVLNRSKNENMSTNRVATKLARNRLMKV